MTPLDNPFSDESAPNKAPDTRKKDAKIENVVDELRQVLAGLGQGEPDPIPVEEAFTPPAEPEMFRGEPAFRKDPFNPEPSESKPDVSDADFWKGNVLGWPTEPNGNSMPEPMEPISPMPTNGAEEAFHVPSEAPALPPVEEPAPFDPRWADIEEKPKAPEPIKIETPFIAEPEMPPAEPAMGMESPSMFTQEPVPPRPPVDLTEDFPPNTPPSSSPFSMDFPMRPSSPDEEPTVPKKKPTRAPADAFTLNDINNVFGESPVPPSKTKEAPPKANAKPQRPSLDQPIEPKQQNWKEIEISIPKTLVPDQAKLKGKDELEEPLLNSVVKKENTISVGCMFPEGHSQEGQEFVKTLKTLAAKSAKAINVDVVFMHPWTYNQFDFPSWRKAASLAGASRILVLVPKADIGLFSNLNQKDDQNVKSRIIYLEQLTVKALYADVVADLSRGLNAKS